MTIKRHEMEIRGVWKLADGKIEVDTNCKRIEELIRHYLKEIGRDMSGWGILYVDPDDGRLWELTYPQSEIHGGGPPMLRSIDELEAKEKYTEALASWKKRV